MKQIQRRDTTQIGGRRSAIAQACGAAIALQSATHMIAASAGDFNLDNGIEGQCLLGTSIGTS